MGWIYLLFSTSLYTGLILGTKKGKGAGTVTSVLTTAALVLLYYLGYAVTFSHIIQATIISMLLGLLFITTAEKFLVSRQKDSEGLKRHTGEVVTRDLNQTTIDETHGIFIAASPIYCFDFSFWPFLISHLVSLIAFRIFDTAKPWGIKKIDDEERLKGKKVSELYKSFLIMIDDTVAGAYSAPFTLGICLLFNANPQWFA